LRNDANNCDFINAQYNTQAARTVNYIGYYSSGLAEKLTSPLSWVEKPNNYKAVYRNDDEMTNKLLHS